LLPVQAAGSTVVAVEFAVLGPVLVDGRPPRGAIERSLLARLLVAPGAPVAVDELVEAAWPEERRAGAAGSLRVRLARLRALLEPERARGAAPEVLVRDPAGYRLVVAPGGVDAERFTRLAEEAARLPAAAALDRCERALALWRGEPFADLDLVEAAAVEARRLHGIRDRLRQTRALALLETGRPEDAARELEALVEEDPLREELVRDLMHARYRAGRHAAALDAYRALVARLTGLGLQPGPEVRELEALVLRHQLPQRASTPAGFPTNVGARLASVVGRQQEVAEVTSALGEHRIVTLVGPGGVGKTTLATETARSLLEEFPEGAWVVELAPLRAAADLGAAVATTLGLRRIGHGTELDDRDALELLRERLRDARVLIVLDGAEHLLPGLAGVGRQLAAAGAGVSVLVTSRRPLGVAGEAVVAVTPLGVPESDADPAGIEESPAGRVFVERARAARPGWQLGGPEAEAVARICRRLDGLPLALELAASRLRALSAVAIAERLDEGLAVLGRGTLDASIEASHALLAPAEQELFRRLSVFEAGFGLEDAEQVGGGDGLSHEHVLELLVALSEHSMVQAEGDAPRRYRMLEALRADARARLDEEAAEAAARRHAAHLARVAATAAARVGQEGAEAAGDPLIPWRADMEAAFRWALDRRDVDAALELAAGFAALHHRFGTVALAVEYLDRALALGRGAPPKRLGALWWHVPMLLAELRVDDARVSLEQARALAADHADAAVVAGLRVLEGQVELCAGNLQAAERLLDGLVDELIGMGERFTAGAAAWTLGSVALARGDLTDALALLAAACDHYVACHDVCTLDGAAADLAEAATLAGRATDAMAACERALGAAPERPLGERATNLLHQTAVCAARGGDTDRAARLAAAAETASRRDPVVIGPWHAPAAAGDLAFMAGELAAARASYGQALALARDIRERAGPSLPTSMSLLASELRLAEVAAAEGEHEDALAHARAALEHAQACGAPAAIGAARAALQQLQVPAG
jgi:predicted ATPase/DNA-binding SARP family transcriptional activator